MSDRTAVKARKTKETDLSVSINLDGTGQADISTGLPFFDHMLEQIARHGLFDLKLHCKGDLEVDAHHTVEDSALALGEAIHEALGDKSGIFRFGHAYVPMDEALSRVALDLSGRPFPSGRLSLRWTGSGRRWKRSFSAISSILWRRRLA